MPEESGDHMTSPIFPNSNYVKIASCIEDTAPQNVCILMCLWGGGSDGGGGGSQCGVFLIFPQ